MAAWMPADAWIQAMEARRGPEVKVPDYQLTPTMPADGGRSYGLTGAQYQAAADLARTVGVREAARQYGVSHAALLQAWRRRGLVVVGPGGQRRRR